MNAGSQVKEAVSEAGTSLPDVVAILPAGTSGMSQEVQGFLSSALMVSEEPTHRADRIPLQMTFVFHDR